MSKTSLFLVVLVVLVSNCFEAQVLPLDKRSPAELPAEVYSELEVNLTAAEVWAVYGSPDLPKILLDVYSSRFLRMEYLYGDGGQGTILNVTLQPTNKGPLTWHEQWVVVDHIARTKVVRQIEGGYLDIGFVTRQSNFTISKKGRKSCIIRTTTSYIVREGYESGASLVTAGWGMPYAIVNYIRQKKTNNFLASEASEAQVQPLAKVSPTLLPAYVWSELEINLTAAEVWGVYSSPDLPRLIVEIMPYRFAKINLIVGDGSEGTVMNITYQPNNGAPIYSHEEIVRIDHKRRLKLVRQIEGGYLGIGFKSCETTFEVRRKGRNSCVVKTTTYFVINQGYESGASFISASWSMPNAIANYIRQTKAKANNFLASETTNPARLHHLCSAPLPQQWLTDEPSFASSTAPLTNNCCYSGD